MAYDFPSAPGIGTVYNGYVWDGEKWLAGNSVGPVLTTKKNYVDNGAMMVSQENGATAGSAVTSPYYPVDRFFVTGGSIAGGAANTAQVALSTPAGSPNRLRISVNATAAVAASSYLQIITKVEGLRLADMKFGSATAKTAVLQFGCRAPAGTYGIQFHNFNGSRVFVSTFVISAAEANIDVVKSVIITPDTTGSWPADPGIGIEIHWWLMGGSTYHTSALNVWSGNPLYCPPDQFNLMATVGNNFELFDVSLTEGTIAPPFTVLDYADEFMRCRRYFQYETTSSALWLHSIEHTQGYRRCGWRFMPPMRAAPTMTVTGVGAPSITANQITANHCEIFGDVSALASGYTYLQSVKASARL